ncbi:PREDICTED: polycystic kidney disease and receptor for egg jelly-related protein [Chaetura pelagica]|uniref:polycystic kidney disease and receptor for egg jelly-related protein n=1 Tax=Chaetura pelagica TaxID=8897 RepID=UPI00052332B6|nr:PREDICTED: polycystic kidney disease and receptor for egg jelly-related protein [Chaetura pelagica]
MPATDEEERALVIPHIYTRSEAYAMEYFDQFWPLIRSDLPQRRVADGPKVKFWENSQPDGTSAKWFGSETSTPEAHESLGEPSPTRGCLPAPSPQPQPGPARRPPALPARPRLRLQGRSGALGTARERSEPLGSTRNRREHRPEPLGPARKRSGRCQGLRSASLCLERPRPSAVRARCSRGSAPSSAAHGNEGAFAPAPAAAQLLPARLGGLLSRERTRRALPRVPRGARVDNGAAKSTGAQVAFQKSTCSSLSVRIHRPRVHVPILRLKRKHAFFFVADVEVNCPGEMPLKPLWQIYPVPDTETIPDWSKPMNLPLLFTEAMHLTVPGYTLDYGLYLINFTVTATPNMSAPILMGSDKVYVKIERSNLEANIAGGTFRRVGFSDNWTLDGSASLDPDSEEGLKGITFTWYCTKEVSDYETMQLSPGKKCHEAQSDLKWLTPSGPVQVMPPESLPGNTVYYFRLVIEKDERSSYADQTVTVQPGSPLLLDVVCIENCGKALIPTERFILSGKCLNCRAHSHPAFYWSLLSDDLTEITFDWSSRTSTGRFGAYLSIRALTFTKTTHGSYTLLLKVTTRDGRSATYRHAFTGTSPPRAGRCSINPKKGTAFLTKFVVQCSGFSDSNLPLMYKVIVASNVPKTTKVTSVEENTFGAILYFDYEPKTPPSFLPAAAPSQKDTLTLYVQVHNSLGVFTQVTLYVHVKNPAKGRAPAEVLRQLLSSVSGLNAPMATYLQSKDYFGASYLGYLAASILNYIKAEPTLMHSKTQLRETLIETALNVSMESTREINQVVASLSLVTEKAAELNSRSQDLAIKKLAEATKLLKNNEPHWSEEAEIQSSGILRSLSNILRAALLPHENVKASRVKDVVSIMENVVEGVFQGKVPGETDTHVETKNWNITLKKEESRNIADSFSTKDTCKNCFYPSLKKGGVSGVPEDAVISTAVYEFDENPFPWLLGSTSEIGTTVLGFKMAETKANGELQGIMPEGAEITIARKDTQFSTFQLAMGPNKNQTSTTGEFTVEVNRNAKRMYFQILTKLKAAFKVLIFKGTNVTHTHPIASFEAFHNMPTVANKNETEVNDCNIKTPYIVCLPETVLTDAAQGITTDTYNISIVLEAPSVVRHKTKKLVTIHVFSDQCVFLDGIESTWREDTCRLGSLTDSQRVHCVCDMKQTEFNDTAPDGSTFSIRFLAAKILVTPRRVDLRKTLTAHIHQKPMGAVATRAVRRAAFPFGPEKHTGLVAKRERTRRALPRVPRGARVDNGAAKSTGAQVAFQKSTCSSLSVRIHRPRVHIPILRLKRKQAFFFFADVEVNCPGEMPLKPLWRIYPVPNTQTIPDWSKPMNFSLIFSTDTTHLTVPGYTLDYGLYLINFTVTATPNMSAPILMGSDKVYVKIERSDLEANIAGGTFRRVGFSDNWTLDGSASLDPDSEEGLKGITFTWYCTKEVSDYETMQLSPGKKCHEAQSDLKWLTPSGPVQVMPPESLPGNTVYYFRLVIEKDERSSYADQTVTVQPGSPLLLDVVCIENCEFVVQCSGFSDSNLPLMYKVIVASNVPKTTKVTSVEENTFGAILYFDYEPKTPPSFLPAAAPSQKDTLTLYVQVHNSLGVFTQVTLYVHVKNPAKGRAPAEVLRQLLSSVSGLNAPMATYLQSKDYFGASYLGYLAASILNYIKAEPTLMHSKTQLRETLIETALNVSMESTMEINQVVASLSLATEEAAELNSRSQDLAIKKLAEATKLLKNNEPHWSEEAEIQSSGILRSLSNILRAALLPHENVKASRVKDVVSIMENVTDVVFQGKVPGETDTHVETKNWTITLKKEESQNIADSFSTKDTCKNCFYPSLKKGGVSGVPEDAVISTAVYEFDENPFPWLGSTSEIGTTVLGFKMAETKANGELQGIMPEGAEITIARKDTQFSTFQLAMGPNKKQTSTTGGFTVEVNRNTKRMYFQILTKLKVAFKVLIFKGTNVTHTHPIASFDAFHNMPTVPSKNETAIIDCNVKTPYIVCLPQTVLTDAAQGITTDTYNISIVLEAPSVVRHKTHDLVSINVFSDQCVFLDGIESTWREDTCRLGSLTDWQRVHCICDMKQTEFNYTAPDGSTFSIRFLAAKVLVTPNRVDLGKTLIADIPENPVTLLTVLFILALYSLLSLWAMRKDKADREGKNRIIVLPDNDPFDKLSFLVTLYTGSRWGAGTTADVFLQLTGQRGTSNVHCLRHPCCQSFQQGSIDCFLLTTKMDLGDICSFRVWHNNKGPSPSWFLSRAKVENMSTGKTWFFMCRKWLSLEKSDHLLERTFSVTNLKTPLPRIDFFLIDLANSLAASHTWLSIFANVVIGPFSRLQRLSSCLAVLLLSLFLNIIFFNAGNIEDSPTHLTYLRPIAVGIECAFLTIPVEAIILALFKYSPKEPSSHGVAQTDQKLSSPSGKFLSGKLQNLKERLQKRYRSETSAQLRNISPLENLPGPSNSQSPPCSGKTGPQNRNNCTISEKDANIIGREEQATTANSPPMSEACQRRPPSNSGFSSNYAEVEGNLQKERKPLSITSPPSHKRQHRVLWWCSAYLSWALIIVVTGVSSFFIVLYGLSYGYQTSLEWLLASAAAFIKKVLFFPVLKSSLFTAFRTVSPKYCENIMWLSPQKHPEMKLAKDTMSADKIREMHMKLAKIRGTKQYKPLEADEIAKMLKRAKIKAKAFTCTIGFISHLVFLTLLLNSACSSENTNSFLYNRFIHSQVSPRLSSVEKLDHIYVWVKDVLLPLIHNEIQPTFLPDSWSKIIGLPRMRQVRAKGTEKKCFHPYSFLNNFVISKSHCLHKYGSDIPEEGDYAGTWTKLANQSVPKDNSSYSGFTYQPNRTPWTYPSHGDLHTYGPEGYTFYFFPEEGSPNSTTRLDALQQSNWLDDKTWAVIMELTTFNCDAELFCTISVIFEMSHFGILKPSLAVHSFALPIFHQQTRAQMAVFVIVVAFLLIYIAEELHTISQEKKDYVKNISNIISFGFKAVFLLAVCLKVMKFKVGADIVKFYLLHPNDFIPFHAVSHLDQILRITMGFLVFLVILRTLKYARFLHNVRLAQRSLLAALPAISSMALVLVVHIFVFTASGYLAFGQHEWNYSNMIRSAQTIFSFCISAFRDTAFSSNRLLGSLFLASFTVGMLCVLINLFRALVVSAYRDTKWRNYKETSDESKIVAFVFQRLKQVFYPLTCKKSKTIWPGFFARVLNRQPERRPQQHLGLKTRKINGRKMVYLVI